MSSTCGSRSHRVACFLDRRASRQGSVRSEGTRARRALIACGLALPARRITVNLAPANLPKEGSHYDLPIALGLMAAIGAIPHDALTSFTVLGELGLDGSIAAVAGVLPAAISANGRGHGLICPYACGCEAAWASPEIEIVAAARIFLDFEQADDSATRKFSGTGLGLAISKRIIARMEGRIAVTSKETAGSTFTVSVPLPAAPDSPQESFTPPHLGDASVMIVATAEIEASLLARRLGRWGARTCAVTQENIAFALLPERAWDTLVVDYPIASAFVAGGQLSKLGVQKRIVLIRPTERHELPALKSAGFTGYLVKPVATSLAARFGAEDAFEHSTTELAVEAAEALPAAGNKGLSILVAEDNDINALLARALLTRLGHRPTIASNGAAAFESWLAARAAGAPYDLVLMDVRTPEMDGLEAARQIRAAEALAGNARTYMLALTANAQTDDREAVLSAGLDGLLIKPLDRERLREALSIASTRAFNPLAA